MVISLGRVVGSKIRNGETLPTDFTGWFEGDIFIQNDLQTEYPYFEFKNGSLEFRGNLRGTTGEQGPQGIQGLPGGVPFLGIITDEEACRVQEPGIYYYMTYNQATAKNVPSLMFVYTDSSTNVVQVVMYFIPEETIFGPGKYEKSVAIKIRNLDSTGYISNERKLFLEGNSAFICNFSNIGGYTTEVKVNNLSVNLNNVTANLVIETNAPLGTFMMEMNNITIPELYRTSEETKVLCRYTYANNSSFFEYITIETDGTFTISGGHAKNITKIEMYNVTWSII